ncbi:arginine--tRNA ligase [Luteibacter rhizovicinus DSM 16549]|uniref:Arginine--tRNA ligase n=2 Tax=Luteibacter rhizovicinus TaxID=242606 RepID=A0A1L3EWP6_9GAMM|nr:arginine--tRNA ligase [Luteibacter rhizovicinus]APG05452.1 arginine--tRNA ligase [Luteibacter rhizovicinus DSM 16549]
MFLSLASHVDASLASVFATLGLPASFARAQPSTRPDFGDFQCNAALALARELGRPPRELAGDIAGLLRQQPIFASVEVAGPGFVNLTLAGAFLATSARAMAAQVNLGIPDTGRGRLVILDFGGPNVAKPLHVGHLRSLVLGESLRRLHAALGWRTLGDAHLGDWGLQMGMLSSAIRHRDPSLVFFQPGAKSGFPANAPVSLDELECLYPEAAAACRSDPARMAEARADTAALQAGDPGLLALWRALRELSLASQVADFRELGVVFDALDGESDVRDAITPLVERLRASGIARESDGALVVDVATPEDAFEVPPLLLAKRDGAALYATTDLATLEARAMHEGLARVVYVVDQRQALHFEQVFRAAAKAGIVPGVELIHAGFGTVNGADGRPFKTRDGGVARLTDLLEDAVAKAAERIEGSGYGAELNDAGRFELARRVGIGAVKFADLSGDRLSGYVFDVERLVAFEGRTGPYLQYACVRLRSLLAKAGGTAAANGLAVANGATAADLAVPAADSERSLVIACLGLGDNVAESARVMQPGVLAEYAFGLAQRFSRFYAECPVLAEADPQVRASRLALCVLTSRVLEKALSLLAIDVPDRM